MKHLVEPPTAENFISWVDRWSFFQGMLHVTGYAFSPSRKTVDARLILPNGREIPLTNYRIPSADLTRQWGRFAAACRFDECVAVPEGVDAALGTHLEYTFEDGTTELIADRIRQDIADPVHQLLLRFLDALKQMPPGRMLEVGSRNRTGDDRRHYIPSTWEYTGLDIVDGPNVTVLGDAHRAGDLLPHSSFDAVMSFAVFEHLLMPWKAAIEVNKLMKPGGIGLILAPHSWPLHEEPWDYFRFSRHSWKALFNRATGFEIIDAADGNPAFIVAERLSGGSTWSALFRGALMSAVMFRKTGQHTVDWNVSMSDVIDDFYPP